MNEILREAFRHKLWATKTLIAACRERSADELTSPGPRFGMATLNHLVLADAGYVASLVGARAEWASHDHETNDLDELAARAEESGARWERFLQEPVDGERLAFLDGGAYETHAAVVVMQALHHVSAHGEQVCASLKALGVEAPRCAALGARGCDGAESLASARAMTGSQGNQRDRPARADISL
jgi:uncharacterized damage-inducible protein DinB